MKYLFNKKIENLNNVEYVARFKNESSLLKFWDIIKDNTNYHNFADEPKNWAAFCRDTNKQLHFKCDFNDFTILITRESEL
jgi:hypothetical protein